MLYRRERRFPAWLAALLAVVVALPAGFLAGRAGAPSPDLAALLAADVQQLRDAQGTLDIVALEYARADLGGASAAASLDAATAAVRRGLDGLDRASQLARLYPERARAARSDFEALLRAVQGRSARQDVDALIRALRADLSALQPPL